MSVFELINWSLKRESLKIPVMSESEKDKNIAVIECYMNGLSIKDLSAVPLAADLTFSNPISGRGVGADNFRAYLSGFLLAMNDIHVRRHFSDGDYVITEWEIDAIFGIIPVLEIFRIRNGEIAEAEAYFDPRPILG